MNDQQANTCFNFLYFLKQFPLEKAPEKTKSFENDETIATQIVLILCVCADKLFPFF